MANPCSAALRLFRPHRAPPSLFSSYRRGYSLFCIASLSDHLLNSIVGMATVCQALSSYSNYRDSRSPLSLQTQHANLGLSSTVYVGNLSFFTTEEQIYELFSQVSADNLGCPGCMRRRTLITVIRVLLGRGSQTYYHGTGPEQQDSVWILFRRVSSTSTATVLYIWQTAETITRRYFQHNHALESLRYVSGTKLDERIIRADLDPGYLENRQYGRGKSGGQVRDEYREVSQHP